MNGACKKWLERAQTKIAISEHLYANFHPIPAEDICQNCHDAVEIALKAVLYNSRETFPIQKTHDFLRIIGQHQEFFSLDEQIQQKIIFVNRYEPSTIRYPNDLCITDSDASAVLKFSKDLLKWCLENIKRYDKVNY